MRENRTIYAAYGSNMNTGQMTDRCPQARVMGVAEIEGYRLLFRGQNGAAVATIEPAAGRRVPVVLWSITADDEGALDWYEGAPRLYRKERLTIKDRDSGMSVRAMVYVMNDRYGTATPDAGYFKGISDAYKEFGFDIRDLAAAVFESANHAAPGRQSAQGRLPLASY